jgi:hypothetical protein
MRTNKDKQFILIKQFTYKYQINRLDILIGVRRGGSNPNKRARARKLAIQGIQGYKQIGVRKEAILFISNPN